MLAGLLGATLGVRLIGRDQPIVENYVGRQVPTAMVARNLERGSGFLRPQLDTGPFPNLFLVEPPLYAAAAVGMSRLSGLALQEAGRLVSALGIVLAAWGLHGLVARREGPHAAALAAVAFAAFPVTIRYGRAFQPDALVLGLVVAGLRGWDDAAAGRGAGWRGAGVALLAAGLAMKVIAAYVVLPLIAAIEPGRTRRTLALVGLALIPAALWYLHAGSLLARPEGSTASADNGAIWLRALLPTALLHPDFYAMAGRFLLVRAFTPIGFLLGAAGLIRPGPARRLGLAWAIGAGLMLLALAGKAHHEYYWLALAPPLAIGAGRSLCGIAERLGRPAAVPTILAFLALCAVQAAPTWRTPPEWASLADAAQAVRELVPADALLVAPEALLYASDRRGCRLETGLDASRRAAGEWRGRLDDARDPLAPVEFYRRRGARFVADLAEPAGDPGRADLRAAIRRRYRVRADRPGVLVAELVPPGGGPDG